MEPAQRDSYAALQSLLTGIERAWNSGDARGYAAHYARDAGYVSRAGELWIGRDEIEGQQNGAFAHALAGTTLTLAVRRIMFVAAEVAVVHLNVAISYPIASQATTEATTTFVIARGGEGWRICAAHTSAAGLGPA